MTKKRVKERKKKAFDLKIKEKQVINKKKNFTSIKINQLNVKCPNVHPTVPTV